MKIELKHKLDVLEIDTEKQTYSLETYSKELAELLYYSDCEESYFESKPDVICYSGWGDYGDHGEEFVTILFQNLGTWFSWYPESIDRFIKQVNHHI